MLRFALSLCCYLSANCVGASILPASLIPGTEEPEPSNLIAKPMAQQPFKLSADLLAPEKAGEFCLTLRGLTQGSAATSAQEALARVLGQDLCS